MTARTARPLAATAAAVLTLGGLALAGAPSAYAAPGDSGDIKVHSVGTPFGSQRDEPRVCRFYLSASDFETLPQVNWAISRQPSANGPALSGQLTLVAGAGHTDPLSLPSGQYRLSWTFQGQTVVVRPKAFQVSCPGDTIASPPPTGGNGGGGNGTGGNGPGPNADGGNGNGNGNGNPNATGGNGNNWNGGSDSSREDSWSGQPPQGAVGAGGGGSAEVAADDSSGFGIGAAVAAGLAGTAGLVLIRRSRRRDHGAA
ncbi:hypothetical protein AMK27_29925 [Streptomyces sp. CB02009]|uniref:hypothetical protein n=1 Tax=Streptomyces sp. CB02009 TaxID=1703938 RepID=UPI00093A4BBF|nr:hypothetical protein [Streptomyces sp. CB02009]OKJ53590.1 hypothetical protein AMK27_29925 [Streptomyces sp. CB02009]